MNCERCNENPANVRLTQVINNIKTELNVCEKCAAEMQQQTWGFGSEYNLQKFLSGLMGHEPMTNISKRKSISCPQCGMRDIQLAKGGLVGCAHCYDTFKNQVLPLIKRIHGTMQHVGKVPERSGGKAKINKKIRDLQTKMRSAIENEEFEEAATLRDEIRALEEQLQ